MYGLTTNMIRLSVPFVDVIKNIWVYIHIYVELCLKWDLPKLLPWKESVLFVVVFCVSMILARGMTTSIIAGDCPPGAKLVFHKGFRRPKRQARISKWRWWRERPRANKEHFVLPKHEWERRRFPGGWIKTTFFRVGSMRNSWREGPGTGRSGRDPSVFWIKIYRSSNGGAARQGYFEVCVLVESRQLFSYTATVGIVAVATSSSRSTWPIILGGRF